ncbi:MAG: ABC transporter permease, partial [Thermoplasmata archaeon]
MNGTMPLVVFVLTIFGLVFLFGLGKRFLLKSAGRNLWRRKTTVAIVTVGLLVGTAIITSSFVMGDTFNFIFKNFVYEQLDKTDELVGRLGGQAGVYAYFPLSYYQDLSDARYAGNLMSIDGLAPTILESAPVLNTQTSLSEARVNVICIDVEADTEFGFFHEVDGDRITGEMAFLEPNATIINERLAEQLDARLGHILSVHYTVYINETIPDSRAKSLRVASIVRNVGKANFLWGENLFIPLGIAQDMFEKPGMINLIRVSNEGGVDTGVDKTDSAKEEIEAVIGTKDENPYGLEVMTIKKENIDYAEEGSEAISDVFTIMSTFAIIAGIILIVNIFVMLAEERKPEMGVARAVGMKRRHLVLSYLLEGSVYALLAAFLGAFVGLGIAYLMIFAFGQIFGAAGLAIPFYFEIESLVLGFCIGVFITFLTVLLSSWVVSKLNIVRAIRGIPEPSLAKPTRRFMVAGGFLVALGILLTYAGVVQLSGAYFMTGPCVFLLGGAMLFSKRLGTRLPFTTASLAAIVWILLPVTLVEGMTSGMEMFVLSGVFLVLSAVLLITANSHGLVNFLSKLNAGRKDALPVVRIALSYPMKKKFRTGMILFMFALIIFTVTVIAMISSFQANYVQGTYEDQSGGYDIIGYANYMTPIANISESIQSSSALANRFDEVGTMTTTFAIAYNMAEGENATVPVRVHGADATFFDTNDFTFLSILSGYDGPEDVWSAVRADSSLIVLDASGSLDIIGYYPGLMNALRAKVGDNVVVATPYGPSEKQVIGILNEFFFFQGIITSDAFARDQFGPQLPVLFFFKGTESDISGIRTLAKDLEKEYVDSGLQTQVIWDFLAEQLRTQSSVMNLIQVYLGIGLVVGIAGLGIVAIRSVVERTQEIGVMRAIGYKKKMVGRSFLMELSFISLLGIIAGIVLGVALSFHIYRDFFGAAANFMDFLNMIPIVNIVVIAVIAFVLTILLTISSAFKAARIVPAEALR